MINLDDQKNKVTYWVSLCVDRKTGVHSDYFGIEYIPQEVLNKLKDKSITHNLFRIQYDESIMCGFYFIAFIEYLLARKTLLDHTNLISLNGYKKNGKIYIKVFKSILRINMSNLEFRLK